MVHPPAKEDLSRNQVPTGTDENKRRARYVVHLRRLDGILGSFGSQKVNTYLIVIEYTLPIMNVMNR